jgi:5'(3')-deoxyribonucleotidase
VTRCPPRARRVFVDMDGVVVDFDAYKAAANETGEVIKRQVGAYAAMRPIPGALAAVRALIGMGFDVWLATKPPTAVPHAYADKVSWVLEYLPELQRKIVITHDKGLLGDEHDFLLDDRPHKANCEEFPGTLLRFVDGYGWPDAMAVLRQVDRRKPAPAPVVASHCWHHPARGIKVGNWRDGPVGQPHRAKDERRMLEAGYVAVLAYSRPQPAPPADRSWVDRAASIAARMLEGIGWDEDFPCPAERNPNGCGRRHLRWMLGELRDGALASPTKACRWLGYAQAMAVERGLCTLDQMKAWNLESGRPS